MYNCPSLNHYVGSYLYKHEYCDLYIKKVFRNAVSFFIHNIKML